MDKFEILDKLGLTERGAYFILSNKELCERIEKENPIWVEDFKKKSGVSKSLLDKLISKKLISSFSNNETKYELKQKGRKLFIFEQEAIDFISDGIGNKSFLRNVDLSIKMFLSYSTLFLDKKSQQIIKSVLVEKKSYTQIAKEMDVSNTNIRRFFSSVTEKTKMYFSTLKQFEELKEDIADLSYQRQILEKLIDKQKSELKIMNEFNGDLISSTKLDDIDISVRSLNCLRRAEIHSLFELTKIKRTDLLKHRDFGKKSLQEIDELMSRYNLKFNN